MAVTKHDLAVPSPTSQGKVRDIYDLGDTLLLVATDRISAFDWVNPVLISDKGKILTQITLFWLEQMAGLVPNHFISTALDDFPEEFRAHPDLFEGRSMLVHKCAMFPVEFVVRGYLAGSGWSEYKRTGSVCGIALPEGLKEASRLEAPIYTPATKAVDGHDLNISPEQAGEIIGANWNKGASEAAIKIYERARDIAAERGLILCDTKLEFGVFEGRLMLADELLTPDSSRYWPAAGYAPGKSQPSFDKQFVRDYLEGTGWDKNSPQPPLPPEIVEKTRQKYMEAYTLLTGRKELQA